MNETTITFQIDANLKEEFAAAAKQRNRTSEELLRDLVQHFVDSDYDAWFRREVQAGIDDADAGNLLTDEEAEAEFAEIREATRRKLAGS